MKNIVNKNTFFAGLLLFIEMIFLNMFKFFILPQKYFYDSLGILAIINGTGFTKDKAFNYVANIYDSINIFNFNSLEEWCWLFGVIFTIVIFLILIKSNYSLKQWLFIYLSFAFLNIYVFTLSKDLIQFCFFLIVYIILLKIKSNFLKVLLCFSLFLYEAIYFRVYYLIMATLFVTIYYSYLLFFREKNKSNFLKFIVFILFVFFLEIFVLQLVSYENYEQIIKVRYLSNDFRLESTDAVTIINDLLGENTNFLKFICNYIINMIRMMIPIELLFKGFKYIVFIIYQIFVTYTIVKSCINISDKNILWLSIVISFMMISFIFEPDFGSFLRHESALILLILKLNSMNNMKLEVKNE